jgi:hypothetical protein
MTMDRHILGLHHRLSLALGLVGGATLGGCLDTAPLDECIDAAVESLDDEIELVLLKVDPNEECPSERAHAVREAAKEIEGCEDRVAKLRYIACGPLEDHATPEGYCQYVAVYWEPLDYCYTLGRPFLVEGAPRQAAACTREDWALASAVTRPDDPQLCGRLAAHWTAVALAEHASIAAFGRFALQLISMAAPPELLRACQDAMLDETRHAQLAFGLASRFASAPVGPSTLDLDRALSDATIESILRDVVLEGCLGETRAAAEARAAAARCEQPEIRAVLEQIAEDEERHAALAWRFVAWLLGQRPELAPTFERALALAIESTLERDDADGVDDRAWGVLDGATRRRIDVQTRSAIVAPLGRALLARSSGGQPASDAVRPLC